ncbi:MAG TPA: response regulator transcription factor [Burkholderiales bacterium]|nr:response regulator transcription factor [Burkholderiales bacterium]
MQHIRPIRVMLVDDHRSVLWGLEKIIEADGPHMEVVGKATSCTAAVELAERTSPDVVVLDLDLGGQNACEIIPRLVNGGGTRVLVWTGMRDSRAREQSILRGASGLVQKEEPAETLLRAIDKVHRGELWLDRLTTGRIFIELSSRKHGLGPDAEDRRIAALTARERDIIGQLVADPGADNRRLAARLHIGEHTLRNHLSRIYDKLGVPNRLELYVFAQRHSIKPLSA